MIVDDVEENSSVKIVVITKKRYEFLGWETNPDFTDDEAGSFVLEIYS